MKLRKDIQSKSNKTISLLIFESSKNPKATIIYSHGGFTNNAEKDIGATGTLKDYCLQNNINFIAIDFSNNGTQKDQPLEELIFSNRIKDLESTIDFVTSEYHSPIVLFGSSLGGHITLNAADYSPQIKAIVLNCPAIKAYESIRDLMDKTEFDNWQKTNKAFVFEGVFGYNFYEDLLEHDASKKIPNLHIPILIFHGTEDKITPIKNSREAREKNKKIELVEIEGGGHRFNMKPGVWETKVEEFINKHINP